MINKHFLIGVITLLTACSTSAPGPLEAGNPALSTIPMELTSDAGYQSQFSEGDELQFLLSLGEGAYIYMYFIDADGAIEQILPNPQQGQHFYPKGYFLTVPEYKDGYRFKVAAPFGEEKIQVFASDVSIMPDVREQTIDAYRQHIMEASRQGFAEAEYRFVTHKAD